MRLVMDTQIRLTEFKNSLGKNIFLDSLEEDNYIELNETTLFIWDYKGVLNNEKVFNSFCIIEDIIILLDSETQLYEAYRKGIKFDHIIFKDIAHWVKIKYEKDNKRLLKKMRKFREDLLDHNLSPDYYRGIFSDKFSIFMKDRELLISSWNPKDDKKLLGLEENFSFFLKACRLIL